MLDIPFDIAPTDDWTKSLIKVRTKMEDRFKYKVWHKRKELPNYIMQQTEDITKIKLLNCLMMVLM